MECGDFIAKRSECAADLTVAAFVHLDDPVVVVPFFYPLELELARSVVEHDAVIANHLTMERLECWSERDAILFGLVEAWVGHSVGKVAVVGQQE